MAVDFSNYDLNLKAACEASNCDNVSKDTIWAKYLKGDEEFKTTLEFRWSVSNFYNHEDEAQCQNFGERFFQDVEEIFNKHHRDYAEAFFVHLSPAFIYNESYFEKFNSIIERAKTTDNTHFIHLLEEEIEKLEEIKLVRGL